MSTLISVIVPVYNAEKYIYTTLVSLKEQTLPCFQAIIINDGSQDKTRDIVLSFAENDSRFKLIDISHSGPAMARNTGLEYAEGDYIMFMDGDDTIEKNALAVAYEAIHADQYDVVIFGYHIMQNGKIIHSYGLDLVISSASELGDNLAKLYYNNVLNQVWNKLFRRDIILSSHIRFQDFHYGEDRLFMFDTLYHASRIRLIKDALYNYSQNTNTLVGRFYDRKFEVCCLIDESLRNLADALGNSKAKDTEIYDFMFLKSVISCLINLYAPSCPYRAGERKVFIKQMLHHPEVIRAAKKKALSWGIPYYILVHVISTRSSFLAHLFFGSAAWVGRHVPKLFVSGRQNRKAIKH